MPAFDKYGQKISYPVLSDAPNAETGFSALANGVVAHSNMIFANANERAANIPNPVDGMETYLVAEQRKDVRVNGAWQTVVTSTLPWKNVQLASGWAAWVGNTVGPRVRREGSIVYLEGRMAPSSGTFAKADNVIIGTIPNGYQPVGHYAETSCTLSHESAYPGTPLGRIEIWHDTAATNPGTIRLFTDKTTSFVGFSAWWFVN